MRVPNFITQELKAINKLYFAVFNPCIKEPKSMSYGRGRWQVRMWEGNSPKRFDLWNCYGYSDVIFAICKEEMTDEGLIDAGYKEMDMRVITAIKRSNHWKADYKKKIEDIDWNNEMLERKAKERLEYESKYMAKKIWRNLNEPTVFLSGKQWEI